MAWSFTDCILLRLTVNDDDDLAIQTMTQCLLTLSGGNTGSSFRSSRLRKFVYRRNGRQLLPFYLIQQQEVDGAEVIKLLFFYALMANTVLDTN